MNYEDPANVLFSESLWSSSFVILTALLVFYIPIIIIGLSYSQIQYILADNPGTSPTKIIKLSVVMMKGNKRWMLLLSIIIGITTPFVALFTLGIGLIWWIPFTYTVTANFFKMVHEDFDRNSELEDSGVIY